MSTNEKMHGIDGSNARNGTIAGFADIPENRLTNLERRLEKRVNSDSNPDVTGEVDLGHEGYVSLDLENGYVVANVESESGALEDEYVFEGSLQEYNAAVTDFVVEVESAVSEGEALTDGGNEGKAGSSSGFHYGIGGMEHPDSNRDWPEDLEY